jgi:hypothetical protein
MLSDTELGMLQRISLISSCRSRKTACIIESIGVFVEDISNVACWKDSSNDDTKQMESQSVSLILNGWRSLFLETKELVASQ